MNLARLVALLLFLLAALYAFGWLLAANEPRALGLIAIGLALEVLAGVVVIPLGR